MICKLLEEGYEGVNMLCREVMWDFLQVVLSTLRE